MAMLHSIAQLKRKFGAILPASMSEYASQQQQLSFGYNRKTLIRDDSVIHEMHKQLSAIHSKLAQNNERLTKLRNRLRNKISRLQVCAPVYGLLKGMKFNTIGRLIEPVKTLMETVPLEKHLVVEARIRPKDIGHVRLSHHHVGNNAKRNTILAYLLKPIHLSLQTAFTER